MEIESFKLKEMIAEEVNNRLLSKYPVGSIYLSVSSTNPSSFIGGTWTQLKDRFLLGAGDKYIANGTGGSETVALTIDQMPSHTHTFTGTAHYHGIGNHTHNFSATTDVTELKGEFGCVGYTEHLGTGAFKKNYSNYNADLPSGSSFGGLGYIMDASHRHTLSGTTGNTVSGNTGTTTQTGSNSKTGGGKAHNNMPPYLTVYMWKRTA